MRWHAMKAFMKPESVCHVRCMRGRPTRFVTVESLFPTYLRTPTASQKSCRKFNWPCRGLFVLLRAGFASLQYTITAVMNT